MAKTKSFNVQKKTLGANNYQSTLELLRGARIRIIANTGGHNYGGIGDIIILDGPHINISGGAGNNFTQLNQGIMSGNALRFTEFTLLTELTEKKLLDANEDLEKEISKLKLQQEDNLAKITFMKEVGSKKYNDKEFKAYRTLQLVDDPNLSRIKKAKLIAKLID